MAAHSPAARLTDIVEAIELIRTEMAGITLEAFEPDIRKRWIIERGTFAKRPRGLDALMWRLDRLTRHSCQPIPSRPKQVFPDEK